MSKDGKTTNKRMHCNMLTTISNLQLKNKRGEKGFYLVLVEQKDHEQKTRHKEGPFTVEIPEKRKRTPRLFLGYFLQITFT
jgi:hypothetical protein